MNQCVCGENVFNCDLSVSMRVVILDNGILKFELLRYSRIDYIRCFRCKIIYQHRNGKVSIPRDVLIETCRKCGGNGFKCLSCIFMPYRTKYNIPRIDYDCLRFML